MQYSFDATLNLKCWLPNIPPGALRGLLPQGPSFLPLKAKRGLDCWLLSIPPGAAAAGALFRHDDAS